MKHFVYITTNLNTGKQYVGDHSTSNLNDGYLGSGIHLIRSIKKYGKKEFNQEILEFFYTKQEAFDAQEKYINKYNTLTPNGYNISPTGGSELGGFLSNETKGKISKANKGKISFRKGKSFPEVLGELNGMFGQTHTPESVQKIKNANIGKKWSEEINKKKGRKGKENVWFGQKHTEKTKRKMSEIAKNRKINPMQGKTHSEETKLKLKLQKLKLQKIDLNKDKLLEIKELYKNISNVEISKKYKISYMTVRNIFKGKYDWLL